MLLQGRKRSGAWFIRFAVAVMIAAVAVWFGAPSVALAQSQPKPRPATLYWGEFGQFLYVDVAFTDVVDERIRSKLARGLPTTILFTGLLHRPGVAEPVATTVQSCKITWHVWEELYRVEVSRPDSKKPRRHWTPSLLGVLRRCAQAQGLLVASERQVPRETPLQLRATVRVNPVSPEVLRKIKRWVSRPTSTSTAAPGSALFSTFTGLFMTSVGDAEKTVTFVTVAHLPLPTPPTLEPVQAEGQ